MQMNTKNINRVRGNFPYCIAGEAGRILDLGCGTRAGCCAPLAYSNI